MHFHIDICGFGRGWRSLGQGTPLQKFSLIKCKYIVISYPPPKKKKTLETLTHANKTITDTLPLTQNWYE